MNTENNYSGMERKKTENEIKYFLRKRKEVPVNTLLIGINLLVFLLVEVTGSSLDTYHILRWGGCYTPAVLQSHEYYRLISSMFLHFGIQHLGNNMLVLLFLGDCLERNIGKIKYLLIYFLRYRGKCIVHISGNKKRQIFYFGRSIRCSFCSHRCAHLYCYCKQRTN